MKNFYKKLAIATAIIITGGSLIAGYTFADQGNDGTQSGFGYNGYVEGYQVPGARDNIGENNSKILDVIQTTINRVLGMLSLIALLLCLRGGFQMLTAGSDDSKVKAGTKVLKNAAIGLAVIGVSWLIVSFVFRIIDKVTTNA